METVVSLSPRLVSYFEITVQQNQAESSAHPVAVPAITVCIGLSHSAMPTTGSCMCGRCGHCPGWDSHSFGYHGDNGGFYHASSHSMHHGPGPLFGEGDTVGCGVEYARGERLSSIFFTLNGKFLGYEFALSADEEKLDLYPTLGVCEKTSNAIEANFGQRDFLFDLNSVGAVNTP